NPPTRDEWHWMNTVHNGAYSGTGDAIADALRATKVSAARRRRCVDGGYVQSLSKPCAKSRSGAAAGMPNGMPMVAGLTLVPCSNWIGAMLPLALSSKVMMRLFAGAPPALLTIRRPR